MPSAGVKAVSAPRQLSGADAADCPLACPPFGPDGAEQLRAVAQLGRQQHVHDQIATSRVQLAHALHLTANGVAGGRRVALQLLHGRLPQVRTHQMRPRHGHWLLCLRRLWEAVIPIGVQRFNAGQHLLSLIQPLRVSGRLCAHRSQAIDLPQGMR